MFVSWDLDVVNRVIYLGQYNNSYIKYANIPKPSFTIDTLKWHWVIAQTRLPDSEISKYKLNNKYNSNNQVLQWLFVDKNVRHHSNYYMSTECDEGEYRLAQFGNVWSSINPAYNISIILPQWNSIYKEDIYEYGPYLINTDETNNINIYALNEISIEYLCSYRSLIDIMFTGPPECYVHHTLFSYTIFNYVSICLIILGIALLIMPMLNKCMIFVILVVIANILVFILAGAMGEILYILLQGIFLICGVLCIGILYVYTVDFIDYLLKKRHKTTKIQDGIQLYSAEKSANTPIITPLLNDHSTFILNGVIIPKYGRLPIDSKEWKVLRYYCAKRDGGKQCVMYDANCYGAKQLHHKILISEGGTNEPSNLEWRCEAHHSQEHPHMIKALLIQRDTLTI
jgi:hypothetical protein